MKLQPACTCLLGCAQLSCWLKPAYIGKTGCKQPPKMGRSRPPEYSTPHNHSRWQQATEMLTIAARLRKSCHGLSCSKCEMSYL